MAVTRDGVNVTVHFTPRSDEHGFTPAEKAALEALADAYTIILLAQAGAVLRSKTTFETARHPVRSVWWRRTPGE